jgi:hypothetical protein
MEKVVYTNGAGLSSGTEDRTSSLVFFVTSSRLCMVPRREETQLAHAMAYKSMLMTTTKTTSE